MRRCGAPAPAADPLDDMFKDRFEGGGPRDKDVRSDTCTYLKEKLEWKEGKREMTINNEQYSFK